MISKTQVLLTMGCVLLAWTITPDRLSAFEYVSRPMFEVKKIWAVLGEMKRQKRLREALEHEEDSLKRILRERTGQKLSFETPEIGVRKAELRVELGRIHIRSGRKFLELRHYVEAAEKFEQALSEFSSAGHWKYACRALIALGKTHFRAGRYSEATEYLEDAIAQSRAIRDLQAEWVALVTLAAVHERRLRVGRAFACYIESIGIRRKLADVNIRVADLADESDAGILAMYVFGDRPDFPDLPESVRYLETSLKRIKECMVGPGSPAERKKLAQISERLADIYSDWGKYSEAENKYRLCLDLTKSMNDANHATSVRCKLGRVLADTAKYDQAVACFRQALDSSNLADRGVEAFALNGMGEVSRIRGQYFEAAAFFQKALNRAEETKDFNRMSNSVTSLARLYDDWGDYLKASKYYARSLEIVSKTGNRKAQGNILFRLGAVYGHLGQFDRERQYYDKALAIFGELGYVWGRSQILLSKGRLLAAQGKHDDALRVLLKSLDIHKALGLPLNQPKKMIGEILLEMGERDKALRFVRESSDMGLQARMHVLNGEYDRARECYKQLLQSAEYTRDAEKLFVAYTGLGLVHEKLGAGIRAQDYYSKACSLTEGIRAGLSRDQRTSFFEVTVSGFGRTAPYEGLARVLVTLNGNGLEALRVSEFTKGRLFAEAISCVDKGRHFDLPSEVLKAEEQIQNRLAGLNRQLRNAYENKNKGAIRELEPRLKNLEEQFVEHKRMLRAEYPLFAATKYPEPIELAQTALTEDEWVLSFDVTNPGVLIYLTKGKKLIKSLYKEIPRKEIDQLVLAFREPLEIRPGDDMREKMTSFDFESGMKLADILLSDILADLPEGKPLIVVPDDTLGVLPFEMLVLKSGGQIKTDKSLPYVTGTHFFGDRNPISYYQSITALTLARTLGNRRRSGEKLLVLDDPVFEDDDPRIKQDFRVRGDLFGESLKYLLMGMKDELDITFSRLRLTGKLGESLDTLYADTTVRYTGTEATKTELLKRPLDEFGTVVFATHGYFGRDLPGIQEPVLVLTLVGLPQGKDGFLRMSEVMALKMNADVVALTACQTGLGRRLTGEGTMGMGRAFQYAGAKAVLMSLWSVAEQSSVKLVESFFRNLKNGKSKLEALSLARKEIRKAGYDHPFFWAGFILAGEVN